MNDAAIIVMTAALVLVTAYYAWQNRQMVQEMRAARAVSVLPKVVVRWTYVGPGIGLPHITNVGVGAALDVDVELAFEPGGGFKRRWRSAVLTPGDGAFTSGSYPDARREAELASEITHYFHPLASPLAARAALWSGQAADARTSLDALVASGYKGAAVELDTATVRAGIAALEGRGAEALAAYREVLHGWRQHGLAFDEALAVTDMATLLPPG